MPIAHCPLHKIRFQVQDTGVGMTKEQLEKIFLPFEQVGDIKKQAEGTGLGLAISTKIVTLMGSQIEVQTEKGYGSTFAFEVELPIVENWAETSKITQYGSIIGYQGRRRKILVVDDRWENRSVIVNLLEPIGFELAQASDGKLGLDKAIEWQPDLIVTDLLMPVMHGFELIQHLTKLSQLKDVAIIASSASVFETDQYKSLDAGADVFLPKPVQAESLLELLSKYLQLEWVYKESTKQEAIAQHVQNTIPSEEIVPPSPEVLRHLYQVAKKGDIYKILDEANKLKQLDSTNTPFTQKLIQLADNFQIKLIREFIKEFLDTP